jgi:alanine racemase
MRRVEIRVDIDRVRQNAEEISRAVAVPIIAVVKANAYGLGAVEVVKAIADIVEGFCVFSLAEAGGYQIWDIARKPTLCIGPPQERVEDYVALRARPSVFTIAQARQLRDAGPVLCVDTGMQRFACPPENVAEAVRVGECREAFTHAIRPEHVMRLIELTGGRGSGIKLHAAGSSLMHDPACRLDAVRPGMALYRGAVRIATPLVEVRDTRGPAGYSGFEVARHGVILAGYSSGLRLGPCLIGGRRSRVIEVGMQSAFVECQASDKAGDEVVLLGDGLEAAGLAAEWKASPQEVLVSLLRGR